MEYTFSLRNTDDSQNVFGEISTAFDDVITRVTSRMEPGSLIGASFSHPNLNNPILIPFRPSATFIGSDFVERIEKMLNSNETINLEDEAAIIKFVSVKPPNGGHNHRRHRFFTHFDFLNRKGGCFIQIRNKDNLCLARSIVTGKAQIHKLDKTFQWNSIRQGDR